MIPRPGDVFACHFGSNAVKFRVIRIEDEHDGRFTIFAYRWCDEGGTFDSSFECRFKKRRMFGDECLYDGDDPVERTPEAQRRWYGKYIEIIERAQGERQLDLFGEAA